MASLVFQSTVVTQQYVSQIDERKPVCNVDCWKVKKLSIEHVKFENASVSSAFVNELVCLCPVVTHLRIIGCQFSRDALGILFREISRGFPVNTLCLVNSFSTDMKAGLGILSKWLPQCKSIKTLSVICTKDLGDPGIGRLISVIGSKKTSVENLDLSGFFKNDASELLMQLGKLQLKSLRLVGAQLNQSGFEILCQGLVSNKELQFLQLGINGISNLGCLVSVFKNCTKLTRIDLDSNKLTKDSVMKFGDVLNTSNSIKEVYLCCNRNVDDMCVHHLIRTALRCHVSLTEIHMSGTSVSSSMKKQLKERLERLSSPGTKRMVAILSGKIDRLGGESMIAKKMPVELLRLVNEMLVG